MKMEKKLPTVETLDEWIDQANREFLGKVIPEIRPPCYEVATQRAIRQFAWAIGDGNPLWLDPVYAVESRYGCLIAPPMFPLSVRYPTPIVDEPGPRGVDLVQFYGGTEFKFYDAIRIMDELRSEKKLVSVEKKTGKIGLYQGPYAVLTAETKVWNQHAEIVCKMSGWSIRVPSQELFYKKEVHNYSEKEIERIKNGMKGEFRAGDRMPLWNDVNVGDKLTPVVKPPITLSDIMNAERAIMGPLYREYGLAYRDMLKDPETATVHPVTGWMVPVTQVPLDAVITLNQGIPIPWARALLMDAMVGHLLTNWMGDDGFLRRTRSEMKSLYFYGDALWWTGEVTEKKEMAEGNAVDVAFKATNQLDTIVTEGTATILLPNRTYKKVNLPIPH